MFKKVSDASELDFLVLATTGVLFAHSAIAGMEANVEVFIWTLPAYVAFVVMSSKMHRKLAQKKSLRK